MRYIMSAKKSRSNKNQLRILVDFLASNPELALGDYYGPVDHRRLEAQWEKIKNILKEYGPERSVAQWKQTWRDLRKSARVERETALAAETSLCSSTGNVVTMVKPMSEIYQKILKIFDQVPTDNDTDVSVVIEENVNEDNDVLAEHQYQLIDEPTDDSQDHERNSPNYELDEENDSDEHEKKSPKFKLVFEPEISDPLRNIPKYKYLHVSAHAHEPPRKKTKYIKRYLNRSTNTRTSEVESLDKLISRTLSGNDLLEFNRIHYGRADHHEMDLTKASEDFSMKKDFEIAAYDFPALQEEMRAARIVKVGIIQNSIVLPTDIPLKLQQQAIFEKVGSMIACAAFEGVNIICLQEAWTMPFAFCTREKHPWCEFAESAADGPSTKFLSELATKYRMVIISPILERDEKHGDTIWNTAVVINECGQYVGKHRKNHIPRVGDFNESTYYFEGNTGHPVFDTIYGKIAINICYGRHHPQNWMMFGINGAEIVFNPSATVAGLSEHLWAVEACNAAIANSYFTCAINRVGTERFPNEFTSGDGKPAHNDFGHFYGSSYITAPDGTRTPGLSRTRDGLLIAQIDLNMCRQIKDKWGFTMTQRLDLYAKSLNAATQHDFEPQVINCK